MKRIHLSHLYGGQVLSPSFMHILPADASEYPYDHGYEFYHQGRCLGECRVIERRTVTMAKLSKSLSHAVMGCGTDATQMDLAARFGRVDADRVFYVFCFQYIRFYDGYWKALTEQRESLISKSKPLSYQSKF
jgi:hypothetical protein